MTARKPKKKPPKGKPGRKPERLKIEGEWEDAVRRAIQKPRPDRKEQDR